MALAYHLGEIPEEQYEAYVEAIGTPGEAQAFDDAMSHGDGYPTCEFVGLVLEVLHNDE